MAHAGDRIPAWRRLGLALKNESQSGIAVPDHEALHDGSQHVAAYDASKAAQDDFESSVEPTVKGKSSKLGKRKHQSEPAEVGSQTPKKSRTTGQNGEINGAPDPEISATAIPVAEEVEAAPEVVPAAETAHSKGDPNYRKKKAKPPKRRREDNDGAHVQSGHERSAKSTISPDDAVSTGKWPALLASTESDDKDLATFATPQRRANTSKSNNKNASGSPPQTDRRKSVAFTPDTKTTDGNTGQDLFKKWVAEQKGTGAVSAPPVVSDFTLHALIAEEEKSARKSGQLGKTPKTEETKSLKSDAELTDQLALNATLATVQPTSTAHEEQSTSKNSAKSSTAKGKKKDPSIYIFYLNQYHTDRAHWKFNKAKQNDVIDNALNIFRIPEEHSEALLEYVQGLKGAGVIERLSERCNKMIKELDEQDRQNPVPMHDGGVREAAQTEAQEERILKERKRRKVEGDVEGLHSHPHSDGYIRRLQRKRAEALLAALGRTAPILPTVTQTNGINPNLKNLAPPRRDSQKRKRRGEVSSDDSSSESSSDEDSSESESDSDDSDDNSDSKSDSESNDDDSERGGQSEGDTSESSSSNSDSESD